MIKHFESAGLILLTAVLGNVMPAPASAATPGRAAFPVGNPGAWVTTQDYPAAALRAGKEGVTAFTLTVSPQGTVSDCTVTVSSGSSDLDVATCALIRQRARFAPAINARGQAVAGAFSNRVRWQIPNDPQPPPQPHALIVNWLVGIDGTASDCRFERREGDLPASVPPVGAGPCPVMARMLPFKDAAGNPVAKRVRMTNIVEVTDP